MTSLDGIHDVSHAAASWSTVGPIELFAPDRGTAVLVNGQPIAMYRLEPLDPSGCTEWFAVSHIDPETGAPVMARGLVSSTTAGPTVSSPLSKRRYSLETGQPTADGEPHLDTFEVRVVDGCVEIRTVQVAETFPTHSR